MQKGTSALKRTGKTVEAVATEICLGLIKFYRNYISPLKPQVCRFYPSCSQYTYEAVAKDGIIKGLYMGVKRIMHCHPFNPGGYHPVE